MGFQARVQQTIERIAPDRIGKFIREALNSASQVNRDSILPAYPFDIQSNN
jgi:hypothetical protein